MIMKEIIMKTIIGLGFVLATPLPGTLVRTTDGCCYLANGSLCCGGACQYQCADQDFQKVLATSRSTRPEFVFKASLR